MWSLDGGDDAQNGDGDEEDARKLIYWLAHHICIQIQRLKLELRSEGGRQERFFSSPTTIRQLLIRGSIPLYLVVILWGHLTSHRR
jgi:hypothetical protein